MRLAKKKTWLSTLPDSGIWIRRARGGREGAKSRPHPTIISKERLVVFLFFFFSSSVSIVVDELIG